MTSSTPTTHILISGAGIAGLALALQLVRGGIRTTIVEQAAGPRPGGQAVDLRGASRDVAARMGLTEAIEPYRVHEKGLSYVDGRGRVFGRMSMEAFDGKGAVAEVEIARGDLAAVLRRELVAAEDGLLDLRYGDRIIAVSQDESGVDVRFEHADAARFDVVVGADGVHSSTRRLVFGGEEQFRTYLGGYAAFFTMPTPDDIEEGWFSMRFTPGATFGIRPDLDPATAKAMLTLRIDRDPALRGDLAAQKDLIRRALHGAGWHADTILAAMDAADDFYFDELVRIDVPNPVSERVVLIGDAGSSGSPMSGMGTATALIGAWLLAERIAAGGGDLDGALARFAEDVAPFAENGKTLMGGGIERMVPETRLQAAVLRASMGVMLSRPMRPLVRRMFATAQADLPLPE
ncbi:FAD-dependent monooxygenase [Microbacterium hydrocarbonoxydans]|uniref:FAD-dependent monooxygenase n=1 Tax=Microbacterium hydrocarbonoxydans TaxID=273678 RepID=UPI003D98B13B